MAVSIANKLAREKFAIDPVHNNSGWLKLDRLSGTCNFKEVKVIIFRITTELDTHHSTIRFNPFVPIASVKADTH